MRKLPVIVIVGATASGKTAAAIALARALDGEIISADSRQFYKFMDIGTAKPTPAELAQAPHHFIDILHPGQEYSAGQFSRDARQSIAEIQGRGRTPIVAGGSGMYVTALLDGFFGAAVGNKQLQQALKERAHRLGGAAMYAELQKVDPQRAAELHPNDLHRIVRALEVYYATGTPISQFRRLAREAAPFPFKIFGLDLPRSELYERIDHRIARMVAAGWEREIRGLLAMGVRPRANALQSVGYRDLLQAIHGECSFAEAVAKAAQHTRNFAKRQLTWFRKDARIDWIPLEGETSAEQVARIICQRMGG